MFSLIPWKTTNRKAVAVRNTEPSRDNHSLSRFRREMDMVMDRFFDDSWFGPHPNFWHSSLFDWRGDFGWHDDEKQYVLSTELPGFDASDIDVQVRDDVVTVTAEHKDEPKGKSGQRSYRYGSFSRTLKLPRGVDVEKIDAHYRSGVLELHLPKSEQLRGKRVPVIAN